MKTIVENYKEFVEAIIGFAELDEFPIIVEHLDPMRATAKDMHDFIAQLRRDTGFNAEFLVSNDPLTEEFHIFMRIDNDHPVVKNYVS